MTRILLHICLLLSWIFLCCGYIHQQKDTFVLTKAEMDNDRSHIHLHFSGDMMLNPDEKYESCGLYLTSMQSMMCEWMDKRTLTIFLNQHVELKIGETEITLKNGAIVDATGYVVSGSAILEAANVYNDPIAIIHSSLALNRQDTLYLDGSKSLGAGVKDLSYFWSILSEDHDVDSSLAMENIRDMLVDSPNLSIPLKDLPKVTTLVIGLEVTNYLGEVSLEVSRNIQVTDLEITQTIVYGPSNAIFETTPYVSLSTFIVNPKDLNEIVCEWEFTPPLKENAKFSSKDIAIPTHLLQKDVPIDVYLLIEGMRVNHVSLRVVQNLPSAFIDGGERTFYSNPDSVIELSSGDSRRYVEGTQFSWSCEMSSELEHVPCSYNDGTPLLDSTLSQSSSLRLKTYVNSDRYLSSGTYVFNLQTSLEDHEQLESYQHNIIIKNAMDDIVPHPPFLSVVNSKYMNLDVYDRYPLKLEAKYSSSAQLSWQPHSNVEMVDTIAIHSGISCLLFEESFFQYNAISSLTLEALQTRREVSSSSTVQIRYHRPGFKRVPGTFVIEGIDEPKPYVDSVVFVAQGWNVPDFSSQLTFSYYFERNGQRLLLIPPTQSTWVHAILPEGNRHNLLNIILRVEDSYGSSIEIQREIKLQPNGLSESNTIDKLEDLLDDMVHDRSSFMMISSLLSDFASRQKSTKMKKEAYEDIIEELQVWTSKEPLSSDLVDAMALLLSKIASLDNNESIISPLSTLVDYILMDRYKYPMSVFIHLENCFTTLLSMEPEEDMVYQLFNLYQKVLFRRVDETCSGELLTLENNDIFEVESIVLNAPYRYIQFPLSLDELDTSPIVSISREFIESATNSSSILVRFIRYSTDDFEGNPISVDFFDRDGLKKIEVENTGRHHINIQWPKHDQESGECVWKTEFKEDDWETDGCSTAIYHNQVHCNCYHLTVFAFDSNPKHGLPFWIWIIIAIAILIFLIGAIVLIVWMIRANRSKREDKNLPIDSRDVFSEPHVSDAIKKSSSKRWENFSPVISNRFSSYRGKHSAYRIEDALSKSTSVSESNDMEKNKIKRYPTYQSERIYEEMELELQIKVEKPVTTAKTQQTNFEKKERISSTNVARFLPQTSGFSFNPENDFDPIQTSSGTTEESIPSIEPVFHKGKKVKLEGDELEKIMRDLIDESGECSPEEESEE